MAGVAEDVLCGTRFDDSAGIHDIYPLGIASYHAQIMCYNHQMRY